MRRRALLAGLAMAAGDGLVRPLNAPQAGAVATGVQPGVTSGVVIARYVIVFGTGDGVFVYSGTPKAGNPPIAWMGSGLADPYGNVLPSTTGVAGAGTFQAGNTVITPSGQFAYAAAPQAGNLIASVVSDPSVTQDSEGNAVLQGIVSYDPAGPPAGDVSAAQLNDAGLAFWTAATQAGPYSQIITINLDILGGYLFIDGPVVNSATLDSPTVITTDPGTAASTFGTDWGKSGDGADGAVFTMGNDGWVTVLVDVHTTGSSPSDNICDIPAGYTPNSSIVCGVMAPTAGGAGYILSANTNGTLASAGVPDTSGVRYAGMARYPGPNA